MSSTPVKFIDLFAGIGGFHYALHKHRAKCTFACEIDDLCRDTYQTNFTTSSPHLFKPQFSGASTGDLFLETGFANDITKLSPESVPYHDILCAGFPCQPFSKAGKQQGFNDTRGTLFFNVMEIVKAKKPRVVFLENVKHLVRHDGGNTLKVVLAELKQAGYVTSWKLLNAKDFGLAQSRERIVIIAHKSLKFNFDVIHGTPHKCVKDVIDRVGDFQYLDKTDYTLFPEEKWRSQKSGLIFCGYRNANIRKAGIRPNTEHLSRTHKQPHRIYHINGTHPTLISTESSGRFWISNGDWVRKLTLCECYRLQGFPSSFHINPRASAAYNQIGNSVAIPMIEAIYNEIRVQML